MEKTYNVTWWEEIYDTATDMEQKVVAFTKGEATSRVKARNPRGKKFKATEICS